MPQEIEPLSEVQQIVTFRERLICDTSLRTSFEADPDAVLEREASSFTPRVRALLKKMHATSWNRDDAPPSSSWME